MELAQPAEIHVLPLGGFLLISFRSGIQFECLVQSRRYRMDDHGKRFGMAYRARNRVSVWRIRSKKSCSFHDLVASRGCNDYNPPGTFLSNLVLIAKWV